MKCLRRAGMLSIGKEKKSGRMSDVLCNEPAQNVPSCLNDQANMSIWYA